MRIEFSWNISEFDDILVRNLTFKIFFSRRRNFLILPRLVFASREFFDASRNISFTSSVVAQSRVYFFWWTNRFALSTSESKSESSSIINELHMHFNLHVAAYALITRVSICHFVVLCMKNIENSDFFFEKSKVKIEKQRPESMLNVKVRCLHFIQVLENEKKIREISYINKSSAKNTKL